MEQKWILLSKGIQAKLQVLDVGINKPFMDYVKQCYEEFMVKNDGKKVSRLDVAKWVSTAWGKIHVSPFVIHGIQ